jgi:hypothetical protein
MKKQANKKKDDRFQTLSRVAIVLVLLMALAGFTLNMSFFSIFKATEKGDLVVIDYTLLYEDDRPLFSSVEQTIESGYNEGMNIGYTPQMLVEAGSEMEESMQNVDVYYYNPDYSSVRSIQFPFFQAEMDAITAAVTGMKENGRKTVEFDFWSDLKSTLTPEQFANIGGNFTTAEVGDVVPMGFTEEPIISIDNNTPEIAVRWATVIEKNDTITLRYGYPAVEITVVEIRG